MFVINSKVVYYTDYYIFGRKGLMLVHMVCIGYKHAVTYSHMFLLMLLNYLFIRTLKKSML